MKLPCLFWAVLLVPGTLSRAESEKAWQIIPGQQIGKVRIGMEHAEVFRLLGTPHRQVDLEMGAEDRVAEVREGAPVNPLNPAYKDMLREDWITPHPPREIRGGGETAGFFMADFVTVYFFQRKVFQIEVHAPRFKTRTGFSSGSTGLAWQKQYPKYKETFGGAPHLSAGGIPNARHLFAVDDEVEQGIAWRFGGFTGLAADPEPDEAVEVVTVHTPGHPVLIDPDGASRFIWKDYPTALSKDLQK